MKTGLKFHHFVRAFEWLLVLSVMVLLPAAAVSGQETATPVDRPEAKATQTGSAEKDDAGTEGKGTEGKGTVQNKKAADNFVSAVDLLPASTAGVVRIPSLPIFCDAWSKTQLGKLVDSEEMKPFIEEQRERASSFLNSVDRKIGLRPQDLYDIASGEVVAAWMSFAADKRRPYSLAVVADIRGNVAKADQAAAKIDQDLIAGGAKRRDVTYGDQTIRVYRTKPKPGQLKLEEIAISWNKERFMAADRDLVIQGLLDVSSGKQPRGAFSKRASYNKIKADALAKMPLNADNGDVCWEWYAEPFAMGRILREVFEYDRRDDLDILNLLERQGFGVIEALGGMGIVGGEQFDVLHRGSILAPGKFIKAAQMIQPISKVRAPLPDFPTDDTGSFYRLNWDLEKAFWAAEPLVNDALGDDLFRPVIQDIRDDPEGPQIDLAKDFLPNLDDEVILVTDNTMPAGPESDRMLVAIRVKDAKAIADVIRKAMEVEPDATKLDVEEFDVWRVERGSGDEDIDAELQALGFGDDIEIDEQPPLLNHWAIAVVEGQGPDAVDYLMFSSHSDLLIKLGLRVATGAPAGLSATDSTDAVIQAIDKLAANKVTYTGVFHPSLSLRARYELLRQNKLKDSDSLIANLLKRIVEKNENGEPDPIQAKKLPPFAKIQTFLSSGGSFWQETESGWSMTGFMLAK